MIRFMLVYPDGGMSACGIASLSCVDLEIELAMAQQDRGNVPMRLDMARDGSCEA